MYLLSLPFWKRKVHRHKQDWCHCSERISSGISFWRCLLEDHTCPLPHTYQPSCLLKIAQKSRWLIRYQQLCRLPAKAPTSHVINIENNFCITYKIFIEVCRSISSCINPLYKIDTSWYETYYRLEVTLHLALTAQNLISKITISKIYFSWFEFKSSFMN